MELSCSNIQKILIFSQNKGFLILSQMKKLLTFFQKKVFLIFQETEPCYTPGIGYSEACFNATFLYFRKRTFRTLLHQNFLTFQERNIQNPAITELSYISGKEYSEPCHNGTVLYFRKGIFRTLT